MARLVGYKTESVYRCYAIVSEDALTTVESLATSATEDGAVGPPPQSIRYAPTTTGNALHAAMTNVRLSTVCSFGQRVWCVSVFIA